MINNRLKIILKKVFQKKVLLIKIF